MLEERGYSGVSGGAPTLFGIGGGGNLGRIRFDFFVNVSGKTSRSSRGGEDVWTSVGDITFAAGYDVFRTGGFSLFGLGGAGVSTIHTEAHVLRVGEKDDRVKQESGVLTLDFGAEQIIPLGRASVVREPVEVGGRHGVADGVDIDEAAQLVVVRVGRRCGAPESRCTEL